MSQDYADSTAGPTTIRYQIVGWATLMSLLLYLHRFSISICYGYIQQDLNLSATVISYLSTAFFITYAFGQVPSGWLTDRFGVRLMLSFYILAWSALTGLFAFAQGFVLLFTLELLRGLAQAGAYPAGARLIRDWSSPATRGFGSALVALGGRIGGAVAPILTAWMMIQFVPVTANSLVTPSTFLDAPALAKTLAPSGEEPRSPRAEHIWQHLNTGEQSLIRDIARKDAADSEQRQQLRAMFDRLIEGPNLYEPKLFEDVIEKAGRRLGDQISEEGHLSEPELQRLNRFTLEAAFPKLLGNIYVHGWRPSMLVYGLIGLVIAALFWRQVRNSPAEDSRCNAAERKVVECAPTPDAPPVAEGFPWLALMTNISLWGNCLMQFTTNVGWVFLVRSMPQYLDEVHRVPLVTRGLMTSMPIWVGVIGVFYGGRLTDWLGQRFGLKWGRRGPILLTRFTAAAGYLICIALSLLVPNEQAPSWIPWVYVAALSLVALSTDVGVPAVWAFAQDVGGKYTASVLGWGNMWGNLGAAAATPFYALILGQHAGIFEWNLLFGCLAGVFLLGAVGTVLMDSSKPLK